MDDQEPNEGDVKVTICSDCGDECECYWGPDPYADEIGGDASPRWMCDLCLQSSAEDI